MAAVARELNRVAGARRERRDCQATLRSDLGRDCLAGDAEHEGRNGAIPGANHAVEGERCRAREGGEHVEIAGDGIGSSNERIGVDDEAVPEAGNVNPLEAGTQAHFVTVPPRGTEGVVEHQRLIVDHHIALAAIDRKGLTRDPGRSLRDERKRPRRQPQV